MKIERIEPLITAEQAIRLVEFARGAHTSDLERAVARLIVALCSPPCLYQEGDTA